MIISAFVVPLYERIYLEPLEAHMLASNISDLLLKCCHKKQENVPAKFRTARLAMGLSLAWTELR